jgi:hypothetical protein
VLGRHHSHSSLDSGHSAWVSNVTDHCTCTSIRAHIRFLAVVVAGSLIVCLSYSLRLTRLTYCFRQPVYLIWLNAEPILLFLHQQPDVAHLAAVYLKYASIGLPAYAFNAISRCAIYPIKENQLTVFKSIFPVAGSLYSSDTDNPRGCAHQCSS